MKSLILLPIFFAIAYGAGHPYSFGYVTADGQSRQESGHGGAVTGSYSYIDANGHPRKVSYVADAFGYRPVGDVSVDKVTAAHASALAAVAPAGTVPAGHGALLAAPAVGYGHGHGLGYGYGYGHAGLAYPGYHGAYGHGHYGHGY